MEKHIYLPLSKKQCFLLLVLVQSVIVFLSTFSRNSIDCRLDELRDFRDYLDLIFSAYDWEK